MAYNTDPQLVVTTGNAKAISPGLPDGESENLLQTPALNYLQKIFIPSQAQQKF